MVVGALDALRQIPLPGDARALLDTLLFNLLKEVTTTCLHGIPITSATYVRPRNFFLRLACQSGLWGEAGGSGKTGLRGLLYPVRGKSISCNGTGGISRVTASVDINGNLTLGAYLQSASPTWNYCAGSLTCVTSDGFGCVTTAELTPVGLRMIPNCWGGCSVSWPAS